MTSDLWENKCDQRAGREIDGRDRFLRQKRKFDAPEFSDRPDSDFR